MRNVNRRIVLALAVSLGSAGGLPCLSGCQDEAKDTSQPVQSAKPDDPAAKEKADKEAKDKAAKAEQEKADKAKTAAEEKVAAVAVKALAVGEPTEGAIIVPEPPADPTEDVVAAPSQHHVWFPGFWHYDYRNRLYLWHEGQWIDRTDYAREAPEPEPIEAIGRSPGGGFFYAPGFWTWDGTDYIWSPGRWARHREGFVWVHPFYENIGGHWESRGWGWEKHDGEWDHRHEGWDHHGDLWGRPGYFHDRENYGREHQGEIQERINDARRRQNEPERPPERHDPVKRAYPRHDHHAPPAHKK